MTQEEISALKTRKKVRFVPVMLCGRDILGENKDTVYDVLLRETGIKKCDGVKNYIITDCGVMDKSEFHIKIALGKHSGRKVFGISHRIDLNIDINYLCCY